MTRLFTRILHELPQTQCGECGYNGCQPYAKALADGEANCNLCPPGGEKVWRRLQQLLNKRETQAPRATTEHRVQIQQSNCVGCFKCVAVCPVNAIIGAPGRLHQVNLAACTGCDLCLPVCPVDCMESVALADSARHYHQPQQLYAARRAAWNRHQKPPSPGKRKKPAIATPDHLRPVAPQTRTVNLAVRARLARALSRAEKSGDSRAATRFRAQLEKLP